MSFALLKNNISPIAVDFGVGSLKVLQLAPGERPTLVGAARLETPDRLLMNDAERFRYQAQALPRLIKEGKFRGRRAVCSISAGQTFVQHVQVPRGEGGNLTEGVRIAVQGLLERDPSQLILRHTEVGEVVRGGTKMTEVMCTAMPRDVVLRHMEALKSCRLEVVGVHTEHVAVLRAFDAFTRREEDAALVSMYADLGYGTTKIVIARGREAVFAKTVHLGRVFFDAEAARERNCPLTDVRAARLAWAQAERGARPASRPILAAGVGEEERRGDAPLPGAVGVEPPSGDEAENALVETMGDELSMCLRYHRAVFPEERVTRLVLVGGESLATEACRRLARAVRLSAQAADPFAWLEKGQAEGVVGVDLSRPQPGWAVAVGLCLSPTDL